MHPHALYLRPCAPDFSCIFYTKHFIAFGSAIVITVCFLEYAPAFDCYAAAHSTSTAHLLPRPADTAESSKLIWYCSLAAKCILVGFGFINMPKSFELNTNCFAFHTMFGLPCHLSGDEVTWVTYLGRFKAHFSSLKESESATKVSS